MRLPTSVITRKTSRAPTAVIRAVGLSIGLVFAAGCPSSTTVHYEWSGVPSSVSSGGAFNATLTAKDANGNAVTGYRGTVHFTSSDPQAALPPDYSFRDADQGQRSFSITLRTLNPTQQTVTATDVKQNSLTAVATVNVRTGLYYEDPPEGGKIRLVKDAASTATTIVLKLVAGQSLSGYSIGLNLPLDTSRVKASAGFFSHLSGDALDIGSPPQAFAAALPSSGPMRGVLTTVSSQKAAGAGAVASDASISAGQTFYTIRMDLVPGATPGPVFNGAALGGKFSAALINKAGDDTVRQTEFAIGRLDFF